MVFGRGIHVSQADRILLHTWWSSKLILGGVGWCWMLFGRGIHVSPADRILLHTWWSSKLIVGGGVIAQSLSRVQLFATPWTIACPAPLSSTVSQSLLKLMSSDSVMLLQL